MNQSGENTPNPAIKTSFFDVKDPINLNQWTFIRPEAKLHHNLSVLNLPPKAKSAATCRSLNSQFLKKAIFALHDNFLVVDDPSVSVKTALDLNRARMKPLNAGRPSGVLGLTLTRDGQAYEMTFQDETTTNTWISVLKSVCILESFHEDYKGTKMIGKGSFAKVYLVESKGGKQYAAKAFNKDQVNSTNKTNAKEALLTEIEILRVLDHDNIIKLHEVHESDKSVYLVMDLINGKPLQDVLRRSNFIEETSESQVMGMVRSIMDAMAYVASKGIMHRDLKPANILLDNTGKIKVIDFGLATYVNAKEYIFKKCGTPGYIAPEVFFYDPKVPSTGYNEKCDTFSVGCILYFMLFGKSIFKGSNASETLALNRDYNDIDTLYTIRKEINNPSSKINKDGLALLLQCLQYEPKKRISAADSLEHPYFRPVGIGSMLRIQSSKEILLDKSTLSENSQTMGIHKLTTKASDISRYAEKNSFFLDVGNPELNGNIHTIGNNGSSVNNSLIVKRSETNNSNPGSISAFAGPGKKEQFLAQKAKGYSRSVKGAMTGGNNQGFLKAAIINNIHQRQSKAEEELGLTNDNDSSMEKRSESAGIKPIRKFSENESSSIAHQKISLSENASRKSSNNTGYDTASDGSGQDHDSSELNEFGDEKCAAETNIRNYMRHPSQVSHRGESADRRKVGKISQKKKFV